MKISVILSIILSFVSPALAQQLPFAIFSANQTSLSSCTPVTINFSDLSTGNPTAWNWSFPGGTPATSDQKNPSVTYGPGIYTVTLTVSNQYGSNTAVQTNYIVITSGAPNASFVNATPVNLSVQFTNTSSGGATNQTWIFSDGTTSFEANPNHTFPSAGTYWVYLVSSSCCGDAVAQKQVTVGNTQPVPVANFTMSNNNGCAPMVVQFFDGSTNATSRTWSFPGGTPATSTAQNPTVTYTNAGAFFANLTVSNSVGTSSTSQPVVVNSMADMQIISSDGQVPCEPKAIVCGTTTLTLTAPGAPATSSYVWGGGGTYKSKIITVYNNTQDVLTETFNCQVTSVDPFGNVSSVTHFFTIHVYPQMSNPIVSTPTGGQVFCDEVVISCDLQEPAYTYTWYRSNNGGASWVAISGAGAELLVNELGTFLFKVKVTGPCGSKTSAPVTIIVNDCLVGNEEPDAKPEEEGVIKFYPSPFTDVLNVEITAGDYEVFFSNASGQIIQSLSVQGNFQIERGTLPPGIYILEIVSKGETILVEEVVII